MKIVLIVLFLVTFLYLPSKTTAQVKQPKKTGVYEEITFTKSKLKNLLEENKPSLGSDTLKLLQDNFENIRMLKYEEEQLSATSIVLIVISAVIVVILGLSLILE